MHNINGVRLDCKKLLKLVSKNKLRKLKDLALKCTLVHFLLWIC